MSSSLLKSFNFNKDKELVNSVLTDYDAFPDKKLLDKLRKIIDNKKAIDIYNELSRANKRAFWNSFIDRMVFIGNRDYNFTIYLK